ncbi:MAG: tRNA 2-thiocytidine biosynthesis protein TtcA [Synergistaceae bacterium]|nr:tRNA 2-thiocytidine biosynthesis protein TtcA [Synergistaceae bacterium]
MKKIFDETLCKSLRRKIGHAVSNWKMINEGDNILVGLSGGKDSFVLLHALNDLRRRSPVKFSISAFTVKISEMNTQPLENYCAERNINYKIIEQPILEIIKLRNEKSPCSFCANMRRGVISSWAGENGFNKIALGHSLDDAVETFFMNLFHTGHAKSFMPVAYMSRTNVTVIRPLVLATESAIIDEAKRLELPIIKTSCPYAGHTERQKMKEMITKLQNEIPDFYAKIIHALENLSDLESWKHE